MRDAPLSQRNNSSPCNASSSPRARAWGSYWSKRGYLALLPDSSDLETKGRFARFSHETRDRDDVNVAPFVPSMRRVPLKYLQSRGDVAPGQIFLQGWSNGASTR